VPKKWSDFSTAWCGFLTLLKEVGAQLTSIQYLTRDIKLFFEKMQR
jgi:hypothetical protein